MPVEFLSDDQAARYGGFVDPPSRAQLERGFFLDDVDRKLVEQRRGHRIGRDIQGISEEGAQETDRPRLSGEAETVVVAYLAEQLCIADASCFRRYAERLPTQHEHAREIRRASDLSLVSTKRFNVADN